MSLQDQCVLARVPYDAEQLGRIREALTEYDEIKLLYDHPGPTDEDVASPDQLRQAEEVAWAAIMSSPLSDQILSCNGQFYRAGIGESSRKIVSVPIIVLDT